MSTKQITHVMAVSPLTSNNERYVAAVDASGNFSLALKSGKPYIIVFVSQSPGLTGPDMIVGTVNVAANGLDTLPLAQPAAVDLGTVSVTNSSSVANATVSTSVSSLLSTLGVTSGEASFIGSVDDLALRLANPDVDSNGTIDALEGKNFGLDWHVRADTKLGGSNLKITDIENAYADASQLTLSWTLASAYATYAQAYDNVDYIVNSGVSTNLTNGGAFNYTGTAVAPTSMSGGTFGSYRSWGPDYDMTSQEMGGSDSSATFTYTLGSSSKQLMYSNVRTKTKAQLNADGVVLPFIKVNTASSKITGISYKWMKRSGSTWADATAAEVGLIVQDKGAMLRLVTSKTGWNSTGISFTIPATSASGTVNIGDAGTSVDGVSNPTNLALTDVCSSALAYDDKMGLRIFAGAPKPATGITECY